MPPFPDSFSTAQTCTEHQPPLPGPRRQAGTGGACCHVLERGARPAECHLCVPGRGRWISSFLLLAALTRRRAIADGTCPEILLWKHAREIFAETIALLCQVAPTLFYLSLLP